jgi:hypothetical protein
MFGAELITAAPLLNGGLRFESHRRLLIMHGQHADRFGNARVRDGSLYLAGGGSFAH